MVYATSLRWFSSQKDRVRISAINFTFIFFSWAILHLNFLSLKLTATRDKPFHLLAMEQNLEHDNSMQKNFNERVAIVHREKSNKCNFCDYASSHAGHLRTHLKMHSGEKTKKCSLCDYASSHAGNLRTHLKMHSGEKSNKCNLCDYASSRADHLRTHLKTHSGEKPNKCRHCDFACGDPSSLSKHIKRHRPIWAKSRKTCIK